MGKISESLSKFRAYINTPPPTPEVEKLLEEGKKQKIKEERLRKEQNRKTFEKYKAKKIGGWGCLPALLLFGCSIWIVYDFFLGSKVINWYFVIPIAVIWWALVSVVNMDTEWDEIVECKKEILTSEARFNDVDLYEDGYIYTDSLRDIYGYRIAKILAYIITGGVVCLALILFAEKNVGDGLAWGDKEHCSLVITLAGIVSFCLYLNTKIDLLKSLMQEKYRPKPAVVECEIARVQRECFSCFLGFTLATMNYYRWPYSFWGGILWIGVGFVCVWQSHVDYKNKCKTASDPEKDYLAE